MKDLGLTRVVVVVAAAAAAAAAAVDAADDPHGPLRIPAYWQRTWTGFGGEKLWSGDAGT